jgi:hypothetical protein
MRKQSVTLFIVTVVLLLCFSVAVAGGKKEKAAEEEITIQFMSFMVAEASGKRVIPE